MLANGYQYVMVTTSSFWLGTLPVLSFGKYPAHILLNIEKLPEVKVIK